MKRKRAGEQARHKQALEDVVEPLPHVERGQLKRVGILRFLGEGERVVRPGAHDQAPSAEAVEQCDEGNRDIGCAGDCLLGIFRLVAEDGGRLEPDKAKERPHQPQPRNAAEEIARGERSEAEPFASTRSDDGDIQNGDRQHLEDQEHAENLRAEVDVAIAEKRDCRPPCNRAHPPRHLNRRGEQRYRVGRCVTEVGKHRDADQHVGEQRHCRRAEPHCFPEPRLDVGVESACIRHMPAHFGEANREKEENRSRRKVVDGDAVVLRVGHDQRLRAGDYGQRRGRRDNHQDDGKDAQRPFDLRGRLGFHDANAPFEM